jgi:serine/threonine protein kinase
VVRPLGESDPAEVGQYRMLAELGRGGMGRVMLGSAPDGRLVAVKLVREIFAEDDGFRERFRREVTASRRVSGAYTAPVIDADPDASTPWLASAFVVGPSLQQAIEDGGVLSEEPALRLAAGLAAALAEVHRAGLVHRDLKPANVLLTEDGLRVIDFGIARATDGDTAASRLTHTGWLVGSPQYMSPEQTDGRELTPASDVFSLGSVLVMACTGTSPFAGSSPPRTLYQVVHADPDLSALSAGVRRIAAACLAKDPDERPDLDRLREMIGDIPASARPWPAQVHKLITDQRAEIARVLDPTGDQTVDLAASAPTMAATRLQLAPPSYPDDQPGIDQTPTSDATKAAAPAPRRDRTLAIIGTLSTLLVVVSVVAWALWRSSQSPSHTSAPDDTTTSTTSSSQQATRPVGPESWDSSGTDQTPFTEDALLPRRFTNDKGIEFARVAGGARPCDQVASGNGPLVASDVVKELTGRGCTQVMTGIYLEQPGPNTTADNPVLVSVTVFASADKATANDVYTYLNGPTGARWNLTTWCTQTGVGSKPCTPGIDHGTRFQTNRVVHRYVIAAVAHRTDLSNDASINPLLDSTGTGAANASGPQNYRGN